MFPPSVEELLERLEVFFICLRANNLKLGQKKCHFLRRSVEFLVHIVVAGGIFVDQERRVISGFEKKDLMKEDGSLHAKEK